MKQNNLLVGLNVLCIRLHDLNGLIPLDWLNRSKNAYEIPCKKINLLKILITIFTLEQKYFLIVMYFKVKYNIYT
jgi:hypothetical protein